MANKATFDVPLLYEGDTSAEYRARNDPRGQIQRQAIIETSTSGFLLQASIADVFHGTENPQGGAASLIIFDFHFVKVTASPRRRFRHITIELEFQDKARRSGKGPTILMIDPNTGLNTNVTVHSKTISHTVTVGISASPLPMVADMGASYTYGRNERTQSQGKVSVTGAMKYASRSEDRGGKRACLWIMEENSEQKDGVPLDLRTAVLLSRTDDDQFVLHTTIRARVDVLYGVQGQVDRLLGRADANDPVIFDPTVQGGAHTNDRTMICESLTKYMKEENLARIGSV